MIAAATLATIAVAIAATVGRSVRDPAAAPHAADAGSDRGERSGQAAGERAGPGAGKPLAAFPEPVTLPPWPRDRIGLYQVAVRAPGGGVTPAPVPERAARLPDGSWLVIVTQRMGGNWLPAGQPVLLQVRRDSSQPWSASVARPVGYGRAPVAPSEAGKVLLRADRSPLGAYPWTLLPQVEIAPAR